MDRYYKQFCLDKSACVFRYGIHFLRNDFSEPCRYVYDRRTMPTSKVKNEVVLMTTCNSEYVKLFNNDEWQINRADLGFILVGFDIIVILAFIIFIKVIRTR